MASDYTVGDLVAEFLSACGVTTVFGIASVHNIPMLDAIGRRNTIRFMMARGELGGAHMADGYARVSPGPWRDLLLHRPGRRQRHRRPDRGPLRRLPGAAHHRPDRDPKFADRGMGTVHDPVDQLGMMASVCKVAYRIRSAQNALGVLTQAATDALTPPMGPVSVEVPIDLQRAKIERPAMLDNFVLPLPPPRYPDRRRTGRTRRAGHRRQTPDAVARQRRQAGAAAPAAKLLDMGFGMVTSFNGRATVPEDHPRNLGGLTGNGMPIITDFYKTVDLCLVVGCRVRGHETNDFQVKLPANMVQIDADPSANGRTYASQYFVCGDAKATLEGSGQPDRGQAESRARLSRANSPPSNATRKSVFIDTLGAYGTFSAQLRKVDAEGRDLGARRDAEQHHLGQPRVPAEPPQPERLSGRCRHRPGPVPGHRRRRRGRRSQDGCHDRRRRLLPQCRRTVDGGAGEPRHGRDRHERPRLRRDQAHPGRHRRRAVVSMPIWKVPTLAEAGRPVGHSLFPLSRRPIRLAIPSPRHWRSRG